MQRTVLAALVCFAGCASPRNEPLFDGAPSITGPDGSDGGTTVGPGNGPPPGASAQDGPSGPAPPAARDARPEAAAPAGPACSPGQHLCPGGGCADDGDRNRCGASCSPCREPLNGTAACSAGRCTFTCRAGYHACGSLGQEECREDADPSMCGPFCERCPEVDNARPICEGGQTCGFRCNERTEICEDLEGTKSGCGKVHWDFEDAQAPRWQVWSFEQSNDSAATGPAAVSSSRPRSGARSLRVPLRRTSGLSRIHLETSLCPDVGRVNLRGKTATYHVFLEGPPGGEIHACAIGGVGRDQFGNRGALSDDERRPLTLRSGTWTSLQLRLDAAPAIGILALWVDCIFIGDSDWTGALHVDDVTFE